MLCGHYGNSTVNKQPHTHPYTRTKKLQCFVSLDEVLHEMFRTVKRFAVAIKHSMYGMLLLLGKLKTLAST